ncbi:hypothetical protein OG225_40270 (plasmid) [Nocardia sp. NBC_01377]|uniref:hypothetical protein n=1 Tax=Nocardia sp. NBC_01377 TaxID=2903595 RepID=UPI002F90A34A
MVDPSNTAFRWVRSRIRPAGTRQHLAYLFVVVAMRRGLAGIAAHHRRIDGAPENVRATLQTEAERRLLDCDFDCGREELADLLRTAVLWSGTSMIAAELLSRLARHYRDEEGLIIDLDTGVVQLDGSFDGDTEQKRRLNTAHRGFQDRARAVVAQLLSTSTALDTDVLEYQLRPPTSVEMREVLDADLRRLGVGEIERRTAIFVLSYLSNTTIAGLDYRSHTPVLVDPGEEVKSAVVRDIARFADRGLPWPSEADRQRWQRYTTAILRPADRARAISTRSEALALPGQGVSDGLWPRSTDRRALTRLLFTYRERLHAATGIAADLAVVTEPGHRDWDFVEAAVTGVERSRELLERAIDERGLALLDIEKVRLANTMTCLDLGETTLDRLVFVGEHAMRDAELDRLRDFGDRLAQTGAEEIAAAIQTAGLHDNGPGRDRAPLALLEPAMVAMLLASVAHAEAPVEDLARLSAALEQRLSDTQLPGVTAEALRHTMNAVTSRVERHGVGVLGCRSAWDQRITEVCAARDNATLEFETVVVAGVSLRSGVCPPASHLTAALIGDVLPDQVDRSGHVPLTTVPDIVASQGPATETVAGR